MDGVLNAIQVEGDLLNRVMFEGPGAGSQATSSAVVADVLNAAHARARRRPTNSLVGARAAPRATHR